MCLEAEVLLTVFLVHVYITATVTMAMIATPATTDPAIMYLLLHWELSTATKSTRDVFV